MNSGRHQEDEDIARRCEQLLDEVGRCRVCEPGLPLGARPIVQLDAGARILIVGQAPGRTAHQRGRVFDDASGDRLRDWLGVDRAAFYDSANFAIVPLGLCYPGRAASGDLPPRPECAQLWHARLLNPLRSVRLTLLVGRHAVAWHLKVPHQVGVTETAADWQSYWPTVLPMPHPSPRNQTWLKHNPWFQDRVLPRLRRRVAALIR